jgi:uncharacterized membrane protein YccC
LALRRPRQPPGLARRQQRGERHPRDQRQRVLGAHHRQPLLRHPHGAEHHRQREDREATPHQHVGHPVERLERRAAAAEAHGVEALAAQALVLEQVDERQRRRQREQGQAQRRERHVDAQDRRQLGLVGAGR